MRNIFYYFLFISIVFQALVTQAQLVVSNAPPYNFPPSLVQSVFLGTGVTATNIVLSKGNNAQMGYFNGQTSNIGIDSGIVLSSGDITVALGPNNLGSATVPGGGYYGNGDPDLQLISGFTTYDAAVLEFDFVPVGDTVLFKYVFASEEYNEYVCATVNDAFGFFLSGPGVTGPFSNNSKNIALIPGTNIGVSINSINNGTVGSAGSPSNCISLSYSAWHRTNNMNSVQFDGFTKVLEAISPVQCGQTYHLKIAIADAGDAIYDSGVFLEGGSFSSSPTIEISAVPPNILGGISGGADTALYEQCGPVILTLVRQGNSTSPATFHITFSGTATEGLDYSNFPDSITFPAGQDTVTISFMPLEDYSADGLEDLVVQFTGYFCSSISTNSIALTIDDNPPLVVNSADTTMNCLSNPIAISVQATGLVPLSYEWSTGAINTNTIVVNPSVTTDYIVTVTDGCGVNYKIDTITVFVANDPVTVSLADDTINCYISSSTLSVQVLTGMSPYYYQWSTGETTGSISVYPTITTDYYVTVTDVCGSNSVVDTVTVHVYDEPVSLTSVDDTVDCYVNTANVSVTALSGISPYTYQWSNGTTTQTATVNPFYTTEYYVTVTDVCNLFSAVDTVTVYVINDTIALSVADDTVNCNTNSSTLAVQVLSGISPYSYAWSTGETTDSITVSTSSTTIYYVTVTDACGIDSEVASIQVSVLNPDVQLFSSDANTQCPGDFVTLEANPSGGYPPYSVWWDTSGVIIMDSILLANPLGTTTYTAYATDKCNLDIGTVTVTVTVDTYPPLIATAPNDTTLECPGDQIILEPTASGGSGNYTYSWTTWADTNHILTANPTYPTSYTVAVYDDCPTDTVFDIVTVTTPIYSPLLAYSNGTVHSCPGEEVTLSVNTAGGEGTYSYQWSNSTSSDDSALVSPSSSTIYNVTVTDLCGNITTTFAEVSIVLPEADFNFVLGKDNTVYFVNNSSAADSVYWYFGDGDSSLIFSPTHYYKYIDEYEVVLYVKSPYGCVDSIVKRITPPMVVWVPNTFTPNGDEVNDFFKISGMGINSFNITIFDRWGDMIFQSDNINNSWDGKLPNGKLAKTGVFAYHITAFGFRMERFEKYGTVTLLR